MNIYTHSEPGGKLVNEDFLIVKKHPESSDTYICALADGQGGNSNAALAAKTACEVVWSEASQLTPQQLFKSETWPQIFENADRAVAQTGGFTTLIAFVLNYHSAVGASSGDSKAFFSLPAATEITEWTERQRKNPPVGSESADAVPFTCNSVVGGRLLVVSDGVWKYCGYEALKQSFSLPVDSLRVHFCASILERSGSSLPDDLSMIAIDVG